jgi:hypothetical protein
MRRELIYRVPMSGAAGMISLCGHFVGVFSRRDLPGTSGFTRRLEEIIHRK